MVLSLPAQQQEIQSKPIQYQGFSLWLTGLSGAGKSTISAILTEELALRGIRHEILDGDIVRTNLSKGLGFSKEDRDINVRRIGFVCDLLSRNNVAAIAAAISPYRGIRDELREKVHNFIEVHVKASLDTCEARDVKGLYKKARQGLIPAFTGVSDPYEEPVNPDITCYTEKETPEESAQKILDYLVEKGLIEW